MKKDNVAIYVCTNKRFDTSKLKEGYVPLLCGAANFDESFGYLTDDTGDNISSLNKYYAELTGQYWGWRNSDADIVGFCHYRRYFSKNILLNEMLDKDEIESILNEFDIILPQITHLEKTLIEGVDSSFVEHGYGSQAKEYVKLKKIIEMDCPDYLDSFDKIVNGKLCYNNNMFIASRKRADHYFEWLFSILNKLKEEVDFSEYNSDNFRVLGFVSEVLLNVYVDKNNLKVKEKFLLLSERKVPYLFPLTRRFPSFSNIERMVGNLLNKK